VRDREHRPERVPVRADVTGQADLGGAAEDLDRARPLRLEVRAGPADVRTEGADVGTWVLIRGGRVIVGHDREYLARAVADAG
jgi:hypothetical protein